MLPLKAPLRFPLKLASRFLRSLLGWLIHSSGRKNWQCDTRTRFPPRSGTHPGRRIARHCRHAKRRAVGHVGDGIGSIDWSHPPRSTRPGGDGRRRSLRHRRRRQIMHIEPLLDDLVGVGGVDGAIGAAMPNRELRPRSFMIGRLAHQISQIRRPDETATGTFRSRLRAYWSQRRTAAPRWFAPPANTSG